MDISEHEDDISIGPDRWIECHAGAYDYDGAVAINEIITPLEPLFDGLETECAAGCCGLDAFRFWPQDIARAATEIDRPAVRSELHRALIFSRTSSDEFFLSERLNSYLHRSDLEQLLQHLLSHIDTPPEATKPVEPTGTGRSLRDPLPNHVILLLG